MIYRKRPVEVAAVQYTDNPDEVRRFLGDSFVRWGERSGIRVRTLEGVTSARVGDWLIRGVRGEFYPCKPDIFEATYEAVPLPSKDERA